jgi:hypothetical protein
MQLIGKDKLPSGKYTKIYAKDPKPPCKRLFESEDISDECKEELRRRAAVLNPVELKRQLDIARDRLLKLCVLEAAIPATKVSCNISDCPLYQLLIKGY